MKNLVNKVGALALSTFLTSIANAVNWTGGGSDELFDPVNWGGTALDSTTDGTFWGGSSLDLHMSADYTVKCLYSYRSLKIDLQEHTLVMAGDGPRPLRGAIVEYANGTIREDAGTMRIGQDGANSQLILSNVDMTVPSMLVGQSEGASFSGLILKDGATLTSNNGLPLANTHVNTSNNYVRVKGEGSRLTVAANNVTIGHQGIGGNNWVEVTDKAQVVCGKTIIGNQIDCPNNSLWIGKAGSYTNNGDFDISEVAGCNGNRLEVVDGGDLYVKDNFYIARNGATGNMILVSNATATVGRQIFLAGHTDSSDNAIEVVEGGVLDVQGLRVGWGVESKSEILLRNGRLVSSALLVGKNDPSVVTDNRIVFAGTNDALQVTGNDVSLKSGAILRVDVPAEGRDAETICLTGAGNLNLDGTMRIEIDASKWARWLDHTATFPLARFANQIATTALDHVTVVPEGHVEVSFTSDRRGIDVTVKPARKGLVIMIR